MKDDKDELDKLVKSICERDPSLIKPVIKEQIESLIEKAKLEARIEEVRSIPYISDPLELEQYCNTRLASLKDEA